MRGGARRIGLVLGLCGALSIELAHSEMRRDLAEELKILERGQVPEKHIPGARFRVAVFTYEDPDGTGLGNALAALIEREILTRSEVSSIGAIRYEGTLSPTADDRLSYFDKVDRVAEAQDVTLSLWGHVRRDGDRLVVDTYAQIPRRIRDSAFAWALKLPERMGGGVLRARVRPDRILVQRLEMRAGAEGAVREAARRLDELRPEARDDAVPTAVLPLGSVYWLEKREGPWIYIQTGAGKEGWVRTEGHCVEGCEGLLEAARFAAGLLRFSSDGTVPKPASSLDDDTRAVCDQLRAFAALKDGLVRHERGELRGRVDPVIEPWLGGQARPGGAAFANIRAMVKAAQILSDQLRDEQKSYDELALSREEAHSIAFELASAAIDDPQNPDVLHNLATLFAWAEDGERARLARELGTSAEK